MAQEAKEETGHAEEVVAQAQQEELPAIPLLTLRPTIKVEPQEDNEEPQGAAAFTPSASPAPVSKLSFSIKKEKMGGGDRYCCLPNNRV